MLLWMKLFSWLLSFFNFILSFLTCVYIVWATFPPHIPSTPGSRQDLFHPLVLSFCWRENMRDNKKDITFWLLWDKDIYTERFLVFLPCTCVLQPTSVHLYQTALTTSYSSFHSGFCQFKITIFTPLHWAHQLHSSFRFLSLSLFLLWVFFP
jgi:hypothetical protein